MYTDSACKISESNFKFFVEKNMFSIPSFPTKFVPIITSSFYMQFQNCNRFEILRDCLSLFEISLKLWDQILSFFKKLLLFVKLHNYHQIQQNQD
ncbi:hypothetical protein BpHYR1_011367 [Brachionus plicatilis]|uniref:Uncharacterized protein n=1 Tax=Brachionus plicatilis TaxID=10195 RepID=A0A3M7SJK1_BRAPC|nr:hypothetical protein BpHYR1_011367 [Brachionus plicatilis]